MFGPSGGGPFGTEAVQKESFGGRKAPRAFEQDGGGKRFAPHRKGKKPMRFGNAPKAGGLDMAAILGRDE